MRTAGSNVGDQTHNPFVIDISTSYYTAAPSADKNMPQIFLWTIQLLREFTSW